ncbi:MAG TPA: hypothetical protein P5526_16190 [Anaerolineae bacterium]|nr:hypothetical protein [Anaerolineae bacterium]
MNALLIYLIVLRIVHIAGGTAWLGGAIIYGMFVEPTVKATAPGSQQFMHYFIVRRHYPTYMTVTSLATILSGALLLWHGSSGLDPHWLTSGPGVILTIGSVLGIIALCMGLFIMSPIAKRMMGLGQAIQAADGPPLPEQMNELHQLETKLSQVGRTEFMLMLGSLLTMATARYWLF